MSFTSITSGEITTGEPVSTTTQNKIKSNFDDHESRIEALEAFTTDFIPIIFRFNGFYHTLTGAVKTTANSTLNIIGARILIDSAGSAGITQVDIKRKRGAGAYESIFTTLPSVSYSAGNDSLSTNAVLDPSKVDIIAGDILRVDITSVQTDGNGFLIRLDYNRG